MSPRYTASTVWVPRGSAAVASDTAAVRLPVGISVPCPSTDPFTMNNTCPVGTRFGDTLTVAVSVTVDPSAAGDGDAASAVVDVRAFSPCA